MRVVASVLSLVAIACGGAPAGIPDDGLRPHAIDYGSGPVEEGMESMVEALADPAPGEGVIDAGPPCSDGDGDGYGPDCAAGADCDDSNPYFNTACPNCAAQVVVGCPCVAGAPPMSCYEGPSETRSVGACRDGRRFCVDGFWSHCSEQATPAPESCNHEDDDCNGLTDDGAVSTCGECSPKSDCLSAGPGTASSFYANPSTNSRNVSLDKDGDLRLSTKSGSGTSAKAARFIWIANSPENTVSRLDTTTGFEVARYAVCADPSRTAVDLQGSGIIACRGDGRVAKVAIFEEDCVDRNQDGEIQTSRDANGDHVITPDEMVAGDECVLWTAQPDGPGSVRCGDGPLGCARAAGVDKDNNVWVGLWNSQKLVRLDGETGATLTSHNLNVRPYGLAIDSSQEIWVASRTPCGLVRVDPTNGQNGSWQDPIPGGCFYGIAIDPYGKVWLADYDANGIHRFDPATTSFTNWFPVSSSSPRGIAVAALSDAGGNLAGARVYAGDCPSKNGSSDIPAVDAKNLVALPSIPLGFNGCPVGVAVDADGFLWTVNQGTSNATKVDLAAGKPAGTYPVGASPYTYSDMTGYALRNYTLIEGYYRHVLTSALPGKVQWTRLWVDASVPQDTWIKVRVRAADDTAALQSAQFSQKLGPFPPASFPADLAPLGAFGRVLEVELLLHSEVAKASPVVHGLKAFGVQVP